MPKLDLKQFDFTANPKLQNLMNEAVKESETAMHTDYTVYADQGYCAFVE